VHEFSGIAIGFAIGAALIGPWVVPAVVLCALVSWGMAALARVKIGGIGGDILGATQQLTEISVLLMSVAAVRGAWGMLAWWRP
jgi:adenosylcobinamide-GDP ribazoletransferase